ncbi:cation:proton antiporter [Streptomyces sp. NPDC021212]|uniref:cation:proton antiporter n=1 Tax=Streptomyces sp. NPDC021212 TaxID=3365118 RepID=UPI0037B9E927
MTPTELAPAFFIAAVVILLTCRLVVLVLGRFGQPPVVGEMIAGVVLGPSLFGLVAPDASGAVFPPELTPVLYVAGQIGLVALMFHAGYEFRAHADRGLAGPAVAVSSAGVVVPLLLGVGLTFSSHGHVPIFVDGVPVWVTAAFVGVALASPDRCTGREPKRKAWKNRSSSAVLDVTELMGRGGARSSGCGDDCRVEPKVEDASAASTRPR